MEGRNDSVGDSCDGDFDCDCMDDYHNRHRRINRMNAVVSNKDDVIDSRDVIERIAELEALDLPLDEYDAEELESLKTLAEVGEDASSEWHHGATLIRDSFFAEYARDLAEDIGAISRNTQWPLNCINWDRAAEELQVDYQDVDFDGETYWIGR